MVEWVAFYCFKKPYILSSPDIRSHNLEALDSIDPSYFENIAKLIYKHFEVEDDDDLYSELQFSGEEISLKDHLAFLARGALFQACELVVMLAGALIQAPAAPVAYLSCLGPNALRGVADTLNRGNCMPNIHKAPVLGTEELRTILVNTGWPSEGGARIDINQNVDLILFASNWIMSSDYRFEYNHFKHGLRARPGGTHLRMARQEGPGKLPDNPAWLSMGGPFGSHATEYADAGYAADTKIKTLWPDKVSRTWSLRSTLESIELCAVVARNMLSCLKMINGLAAENAPFLFASDKEAYLRHTSRVTSLSRLSFRNTPPSPEQIHIRVEDISKALERSYGKTP